MKPFLPDPKPKTIRLKGKAYTDFRKQVAKRANYRCEKCNNHAPLLWYGIFNNWKCGHVSHIKHRSIGGSDILDNVEWFCYHCHIENGHLKWRK